MLNMEKKDRALVVLLILTIVPEVLPSNMFCMVLDSGWAIGSAMGAASTHESQYTGATRHRTDNTDGKLNTSRINKNTNGEGT